jgi:hypothetical protein
MGDLLPDTCQDSAANHEAIIEISE